MFWCHQVNVKITEFLDEIKFLSFFFHIFYLFSLLSFWLSPHVGNYLHQIISKCDYALIYLVIIYLFPLFI